MEYTAKSAHPEKQRVPCLIIGIYENKHLSTASVKVDSASNGYISALLKKADFKGRLGQTQILYNIPNIEAERVLIVGLGKIKDLDSYNFIKATKASINALKETGVTEAISFLSDCEVKGYDLFWRIQQTVILTEDVLYKFNNYKSEKTNKSNFRRLTLSIPTKRELKKTEHAIEKGLAIAKGMGLMKDLSNTPPNIFTPSFLAKEAQKLSKEYKSINTAILNQKEMQALGMNALLAVAKGSKQPPKLITLEYRGNKSDKNPIVFVGKGITFDTGGNSIKPRDGMVGMKYDMSGGAAVLGIMKFIAELELPLNVISVIAAAENMLGSQAYRPEDIITTLSGQTVEVLNTDAEGRLVLCDALTYAERYNPKVVIDVATLTGACIVALGSYHSGVFTNDDHIAHDLIAAGQYINDKCWQLPMTQEYNELLESNFADMANIGGAGAGSITAACFLAKFTKKYKWAHVDIAGSSILNKGRTKVSSGRPIPMLAQYLINQAENN